MRYCGVKEGPKYLNGGESLWSFPRKLNCVVRFSFKECVKFTSIMATRYFRSLALHFCGYLGLGLPSPPRQSPYSLVAAKAFDD